MSNERQAAIQEIAQKVNLPEVAQKLGLHVAGLNTQSPKALCPFHDDHRPSLSFHRAPESGRSYYHCFACEAKGDAFDLVKHLQKCDFPIALSWLASETGTPLPMSRSGRINVRERGLRDGFEAYRKETTDERKLLADWALNRGFEVDFLHAAEVYAALDNKLSRSVPPEDREGRDALVTAGLAFVPRGSLPLVMPLRDQIFGDRIIFIVRDHSGNLTGFAGRALGDTIPKYLYPRDFPKSSTLYRFDRVRKQATTAASSKARSKAFHLYVVEGLVDALRLESLGLDAVAVLGSRLSDQQADLLLDFAEDVDRRGQVLVLHLFLDGDNAGRSGSASCLAKILPRLRSVRAGLLLDVVEVPPENDPDDFLRTAGCREDAVQRLRDTSRSAMEFLLAHELGVPHTEQLEPWYLHASEIARLVAFRNIERALGPGIWPTLRERIDLFQTSSEGSPESASTRAQGEGLLEWQRDLALFLGSPIKDVGKTPSGVRHRSTCDLGSEARLKRAIQVAKASRQRREVPLDEGSWSRIEVALDVFLPYLRGRLRKKAGRIEPLMAVKLPKPDGGVRLKAIPCTEDLILQQYVLNDLLREYMQCRDFHLQIPAIRHYHSQGLTVATGPQAIRPVSYGSDQPLSFAYQIEMDAVEGISVPERDGMFRPYYYCWQDFIAYLQRSVRQMNSTAVHVARFDIRAYYDRLPRFAVNEALLPGLIDGLGRLERADERGCRACAEFLGPEDACDRPDDRARTIVDWLCNHSFNYQYLDPGTGREAWALDVQGVPQGPDLSAYLANIALFSLDHTIAELIHKLGSQSAKGAMPVYGRYVDDMVVVVEDREHLKAIRDAIANQLSRLGLELSTKTEPAYELTQQGFDQWLTKGRAVGLGLSGELGESLVTAPLEVIGGLADAGEIDRTNSLYILYDPNLRRPERTTRETLREAVALARRSPDVRHADEGPAASLLWRYIASDESPPMSADAAAKQMRILWRQTSPTDVEIASASDCPAEAAIIHRAAPTLAWLDGLQRFLGTRAESDPALTFPERTQVQHWQQLIAKWVRDGLCWALVKPDRAVIRALGHMLEVRALSVEHAAERVLGKPAQGSAARAARTSSIPITPILHRLAVSLFEATSSEGPISGTAGGSRDLTLLILHEAVARLRACPRNPSFDPLEPLRASLSQGAAHGSVESPFLKEVLTLWLSDGGQSVGQPEGETEQAAVTAFAAITGAKCVELLAKRSALSRAFLQVGAYKEWKLVPVPPGVETPGLIAYGLDDGKKLRRRIIRQSAVNAIEFDPKLEWEPLDQASPQEALLGQERILDRIDLNSAGSSDERDKLRYKMLRWLTRAFRYLSRNWNDGIPMICPQSGANLVGPDVDAAESDEAAWQFLGYPVSALLLENQAFVQHTSGYLTSVGVPQNCSRLWQIGTALADRLGFIEASDDASKLGLRTSVDSDGDWALEKILSYGLARLRGSIPVPQSLLPDPQSGLPSPIERVVKQMEDFPGLDSAPEKRVATVVAMFADGRALARRNELVGSVSLCGAAAAMLADMAKCQFRRGEDIAQKLSPASSMDRHPVLRRPVLAWLRLANRLEILCSHATPGPVHETLGAVAAGTRVLAVQTMMRSQVVELWEAMSPSDRENAVKQESNLADWSLDPQSLLHRHQEGENNKASPVRYLVRELINSTVSREPFGLGSLDGITPLGWVVLLDLLTRGPSGNPTCSKQLATIARDLATTAVGRHVGAAGLTHNAGTGFDHGSPWSDLKPCWETWTVERTWEAIRVLKLCDEALGLEVKLCESPVFSLLRISDNVREVTASDSCHYNLAPWRIVGVFAAGEKTNSGTERAPRIGSRDRDCYRWSETWQRRRLLSVGAVSTEMAVWAGFDSTQGDAGSATPVQRTEPIVQEVTSATELDSRHARDQTSEESAEARTSAPQGQGQTASDTSQPNDAVEQLLERQLLAWRSRRKPATRCARIALLQWDVDESYRHPLYDACLRRIDQPGIDVLRRREHVPSDWTVSKKLPSCAEHRRISILSAALRACKAFGVDILVLPEYSVRPETINWLKGQMQEPDWPTSIWAGTFRLPPGSVFDGSLEYAQRAREWNAVLTALYKFPRRRDGQFGTGPDQFPDIGDSIHSEKSEARNRDEPLIRQRGKKYPAMGLREAFFPDPEEWSPLFNEAPLIFDPRRYVIELICSEVFVLTSPSNLLAMQGAYADLMRKFGAQADAAIDAEECQRRILRDIVNFSKATSMATLELTRRSIVLVTAMTNRCADYALLGQAGFLASNLVTVFCNAVHEDYGHGQSCFIGHDSWDKKPEHNEVGMPTLDPYHGVLPGIYRLGRSDRGWLGKKEQAMVIADINPDFTVHGSPKAQTQEYPLRLVAHLPIIEFWNGKATGICPTEKASDSTKKYAECRCMTSDLTKASTYRGVVQGLLEAIKDGLDQGYRNTADDNDGRLAQALCKLGDVLEYSPGLKERAQAYVQDHMANPLSWPPPVAVDWLWVDLGDPDSKKYPDINVPQYSRSGGLEKLVDDHA